MKSSSSQQPDGSITRLSHARIIAILRASDSRRLPAIAEILVASGIGCIEITMTTPGALETLEQLRSRFGENVLWGAGTVTSVEQAGAAVRAGAEFLVSPTTDLEVLAWCGTHGVTMLPGALTPTEIATARRAGAAAVKVFPIGAVGGVDYVRALRGPLPEVPLIPTGGVRIEEIASYLSAGCPAVAIGGPLVGTALEDGADLDSLRDRVRLAVSAAGQADEGARE